jgi:hypothetical protein
MFNSKKRKAEEAKRKLAQVDENNAKIDEKLHALQDRKKSSVKIDFEEIITNGEVTDTRFHIVIEHKSSIKEVTVLTEDQFRDLVSAVYELCPPKIRAIEFGVDRPSAKRTPFGMIEVDGDDIEELPKFLKTMLEKKLNG